MGSQTCQVDKFVAAQLQITASVTRNVMLLCVYLVNFRKILVLRRDGTANYPVSI